MGTHTFWYGDQGLHTKNAQKHDLGLLFGRNIFYFKEISENKGLNWSQRVDLHTETFQIKIHVLNFDQGSVKMKKKLKKLFSLGPPTLPEVDTDTV